MKTDSFIHNLDETRIVAEIGRAESGTSGEIRVFISPRQIDDPLHDAARQFEKLVMTKTRHRNGVLLYFAPVSQKFAIIGDTGIHERCGQPFWTEVVEHMRPLLKAGDFTAAVIGAIRRAGEILARHFPASPGDGNELPDAIVTGEREGAGEK